MFDTDHYIALSFHNGINSSGTQSAGQDTVVSRGASATLQVAEDGNAYIVLWIFILYTFSIVHGTSRQFAFGNEDDTAVL